MANEYPLCIPKLGIESAEFIGSGKAPFSAARTDLFFGAMLAGRPDIDAARDHLARARAVAVENGYGAVESRAAAVLRQLA